MSVARSLIAGVLAVVLAVLAAVAVPAWAQTLEELERQVEAAEQRERQAAAQRERERQEALKRQVEAAAAQARLGTLVVRADADCALTVNGEASGRLTAEATQRIKVEPGESLIECVAEGGRRAEVTERIPSGEQVVVRLTVPPPSRFTQRSEGIFDAEQNVIWSASDNGSDIDWNGAQRYCAGKGSGWSLPTVVQLQSLYDAAGTHGRSWTSPYTGSTFTIKFATPLIRWTSCCFWSSEASSSLGAFSVGLNNGDRIAATMSSGLQRALCVRRP